MTFCRFDGDLISRVGVSDDAHAWVRGQDSFQPESCLGSSIRYNDLSRMLGISHAHAATMMEGNPCRAADRVDHRVEDRPIGDRIRSIFHGFSLAIRGSHRA